MKKIFASILVVMALGACAALERARTGTFKLKEGIFKDLNACMLVYDVHEDKIIARWGGNVCTERFAPCSTFKVPLSLMAFDANVLQDENQKFKWDGTKYDVSAWNHDQTVSSWMHDSVVWVSQLLTPQLGSEKIKSYMKLFSYGNQDFSAGLKNAWLGQTASIKISPMEQLEFQKSFWKETFKVSPKAYEKTKLIMHLEDLPHGYFLSGKTGSGFTDTAARNRLGWFVGHVEGHGVELITVLMFTDNDYQSLGRFGGPQAKEMTMKVLKSNGL